jgi:RNA-directed DNA polymerase
MRTKADIASLLSCTVEVLDLWIRLAQSGAMYRRRAVSKGRGRKGTRILHFTENLSLRSAHIQVAETVTALHTPRDSVHGFVRGRSAFSNASQHRGQAWVLNTDLRDFFVSIKTADVAGGLQQLGFHAEPSAWLARICSVEGRLPQGGNASPALANLVCDGLDRDLEALAASINATYTRYADDLTFSGDSLPEWPALKDVLDHHGFEARMSATRTRPRGRAQFVTGLHVGDSEGPRVPKRLKRRLRLELHYIGKYGVRDHAERTNQDPATMIARIDGLLSWMNSIEDDLFAKQLDSYRDRIEKWSGVTEEDFDASTFGSFLLDDLPGA